MTRSTLCILLFLCVSIIKSEAHPAWGITVDSKGNIYFADILHNQRGSLWKLTHDGNLVLLARNFHAHNVSLDGNENLISSNGEEHHTLIRFYPDGRRDTLFSTHNYNQFFGGNATIGPQGEIYFGIENHIWKLQPDGTRKKISDYAFGWNQAIYVDPDGIVYGPDIGSGSGWLVRIDKSGKATVLAKDLITRLNRPYDKHDDILLGMTKGPDGAIYIAEKAGQQIIRITQKGVKSTFYKTEDEWFPSAIAFQNNSAFILEYHLNNRSGPRIIRVDNNGIQTEIFNYETYREGSSPPTYPIILILCIASLLVIHFFRKQRNNNYHPDYSFLF